jgi:dipeptidyl aminopeptidase/acylaminoacyl peptidase
MMSSTTKLRAALVLVIALPLLGFSQSLTQLTPEMLIDMKYATSAEISPDGMWVAYTLSVQRSPQDEPGGRYSELWVVPTTAGEPRQFTRKPTSVSSPQWSPDGKRIAFISTRKELDANAQVYAIPLDGGEAQQLTQSKTNVAQFAWSPDGRSMAYVVSEPEAEEEKKAKKSGQDWKISDGKENYQRLHLVELASGKISQVTSGNLTVWEFEWSPDGKQIVFRGGKKTDTDASYMFSDLFIVPATGGEARLLCEREGKLAQPQWSPDGKWIAFLSAVSLNDPTEGSVFITPASSSADAPYSPKNLTENFTGSATDITWLNDKTLFMVAQEGTTTRLRQIDVRDGAMKVLAGDGPVFDNVSLSNDGKWLACLANTPQHPNEVYLAPSDARKLVRLTNSNPEFANLKFAPLETVRYQSGDGLEIQGILVKPLDFDPNKKYPLVMQVHGGPESAYLTGWNNGYNTWLQLLSQKGYVYFMPNYRGSSGRGVAFAKGDHNDPMGKEFEDMLAGIDYLIAQGFVDEKRIGIGGGSYGGYASAWAATRHSNRFAAAVVFAGVSNQTSKIGTTDTPAENALVHWNFWHYDNWDLVWERSPIHYLKNAKTPTLIAHGERDERVHPTQAWELYRALKHANVPAELILYPREPHGLRERAHQLQFLKRALEWYDEYLKEAGTN